MSSLALGTAAADAMLSWTGSTDNDWFNSANWQNDLGAIPSASREVQIDRSGVVVGGSAAEAGNMLLGIHATGGLTIQSTLTTTGASFGWNSGSTGTASLSGSGASWTNTGDLYLGNEGTGTLSIADQASVHAGTTYLGSGYGSLGRLDLAGGGTFTSTGDLYVGFAGVGGSSEPAAEGILNVTSGTVQNVNGAIANGTGSTGTATITGASSSWTNTGRLTVGSGGVGTLTISAGGDVTSVDGIIGQTTNTAGSSATVTGVGSTWTGTGTLFVGISGASELKVLSGGAVTSAAAVIGRHSTSKATVSGSGSSWNTGALSVGGDTSDPVGAAGNGTLAVSSSGSVTSSSAQLGLNSTDSGTATVGGSGSTWKINGTLSVGLNGTGTVTVSDAARIETAWMIVGHNANSSGEVTVSSGASLKDAGSLYVGNDGDGTLTVSGGGSVTSGDGFVGTSNGSDGTATVTGSGSSWTMAGALFVSQNTGSTGTMTISDGATVTDYQGIVGDIGSSVGEMTVTGAGSTWTSKVVDGQLYSGDINAGRTQTAKGTITVSNGGTVIGNRFYAGNEGSSEGTVIVTGAGSSFTATDRFVVGSQGTGTATVSNGGKIKTGIIKIAALSGSIGTLNVGAAAGDPAAAAGALDTNSIEFGAGTGLLEFNFTDPSYAVSAAISGAGRVQLDAGNLTLSGVSTYTGGTDVNGGTLNVTGSLSGSSTEVTMSGGRLVNSGTISGATYGIRLATAGNVVSTSGTISGGTASVLFDADNNTLNISPTATFTSIVDYNNKIGNTTGFGAGSYRIHAASYDDTQNVIVLNNSSQTVILDNASSASGYINVVSVPAASREASQYTSSVSDVIGSILSLDVARPDQVSVGGTTISALQYGEEKRETQEARAVRMLGDNAAVDDYGNLFWTRAFGGLRYQPSSDGDFSSHTSHFGVLSGVDHLFENYRLGFFAGAGTVRTVAGDSASMTRGNTGFFGLYGAVELGGLQWNASITGGGIENTAARSVNNGLQTASGDFTGWYVSPEVAVSRAYQLAPGWEMTPSFKTRYTGAFYEGYDESGSSQNLSYGSRQSHSIDGRLQVELKHKTTMPSGLPASITATASVSDTQYLGSETLRASLEGNEFSVSSSGDKNVLGATLGIGFDAMISDRTAIYGGVDGSLYSDESMAASGRLGLKVAF
ncbi:autotransporter domain-containing protein [Pleomorphomonas sp. JP5]|uniref:autotransporter domain-containing protein n=1 Tax=Pleomorphomonas sp. JP5 TaxID=2942998 RepID=UPI002044A6E5|nr:autotransporter domain-containing protein [Pleomorphomonas sp. JP5]MCM5557698.1 autotransporter domain-containing protein [Pleomorphomonas sp. JP5]